MANRRVGSGRSRRSVADGAPAEPAPPQPQQRPDWAALAQAAPSSRRDLLALAAALQAQGLDQAGLDEALDRAIEQRQDRAFTHLAFAGCHAGLALQPAALARGAHLLLDAPLSQPLSLAALCARTRGEVGAALLEAVRSRKLGDREPAALLVAALWALWAKVARPAELVSEARIRARRQASPEGETALVALHGLLDDPDLSALVEPFATADLKEAARQLTSRLVDALVGEPLALFPERPVRASRLAAPVRRAAARVGRNDACPCGSGKKYKQCHEAPDRERLAASSEVEGLTEEELAADLERHLTEERLDQLRGYELARLEPSRLPAELRQPYIERLGLWGEHEAAARAVQRWASRGQRLDPEALDALALTVAELAARDGRQDIVKRMVKVRGGRTEGLLLEASLLLLPERARLAAVEEAARRELDGRGVEVGFALFSAGLLGLGIHVARSELAMRASDPETDALYGLLLEARDRLGAPPWDPIEDVLYTLDHGVAPEVERELLAARERLDHSDRALRATQQALSAVKRELEQKVEASRLPAGAPFEPLAAGSGAAASGATASGASVPASNREGPAALDSDAVRALKERVEQLKSELKERHRERNALRRELQEARAELQEADTPAEEPTEPEDAAEPEEAPALEASVAARVRVPRFPEGFERRLREVPEATARATMARVGELCAGYDVAFREVRPLRGLPEVWRAKVGRSYRLLFRLGEDELEIIELLHRQDLEKRLSRLRRGGD